MINAKRAHESLAKNLSGDADIIKEFATAVAFPVALLAIPNPTPLAIGSALLIAAAAGVKSFSKVLERLEPRAAEPPPFDTSYERFKVAYYTLAQRTIVDAIVNSVELAQTLRTLPKTTFDRRRIEQFKQTVSERAAAIAEAELRFHYSVTPTDKQLGIHDAYQDWLGATLSSFGIRTSAKIATTVIEDARKRFRVALSAPDNLATWMRNYLALESQLGDTAAIQLSAIRETLEGWKSEALNQGFREERWERYREYLQSLPEQKDTMYNESFGVSRVFVAPRVRYHRAGLPGIADTPQDVPSVGRLIGALISTRPEGTDLIILSGGPGSGKSTLCRMIASELARDSSLHPVFLRLRRQKEGEDVTSFIEDHLVNEDVISKLSDLHNVHNLIIILDGFDELVMASKTKLRSFFTSLLDAVNHGPLRRAKIIVSGRDTLFPGGAGLPRGSHVLSVLPFDRDRVAAWGERWRTAFPEGPGASFFPEVMLDPSEKKPKHQGGAKLKQHAKQQRETSEKKVKQQGALHQLATWPLTLHLIAQLHTNGRMAVGDPKARTIEKAYLYRSILAETARRQTGQAQGRGRLEPDTMRKFLRAIAWEMYVRSTDTLEVETVVPIVQRFFPQHEDAILVELAEVAVVNAPEIKKGEETGFEFVHKSFAEFLVAEVLAQDFDAVAHRVEDASGNITWHQPLDNAAKHLLTRFGARLLPEEVEEMLRPMIGGFKFFTRGENVEDRPDLQVFIDGLMRLLERMQEMYLLVLEGRLLSQFDETHRQTHWGRSPLEIGANFAASVVLMGSISADRLRQISPKNSPTHQSELNLEPFDGAMWRWIFLMSAGSIQIDESLARRLFKGTRVDPARGMSACRDFGLPIQLGLLSRIDGYKNDLVQEVKTARDATLALASRAALLLMLLEFSASGPESNENARSTRGSSSSPQERFRASSHFVEHLLEWPTEVFEYLLRRLADAGMVPYAAIESRRRSRLMVREQIFESIKESVSRGELDIDRALGRVTASLCGETMETLTTTGDALMGAIIRGEPDLLQVLMRTMRGARPAVKLRMLGDADVDLRPDKIDEQSSD